MCVPFDITDTNKMVIDKDVNSLNMVDVVVDVKSVGCELLVTSSVQSSYIGANTWLGQIPEMPNCHTFGVIMGSNVCRVSNAICIIRAGMNETKLY